MKLWWKIILKEHKNIIIWYIIFFDLKIILKNKMKARNSVKWWAFKIKKTDFLFITLWQFYTENKNENTRCRLLTNLGKIVIK